MSNKTDLKSIKLNNNGVEFDVFLSFFTSGKMDKAQTLLIDYFDLDKQVENITSNYEALPEMFDTERSLQPIKPLFQKFEANKLNEIQLKEKLKIAIGATFGFDAKAKNTKILRELTRLMCLTSQLTTEQIVLIQSDIDSDFWCDQSAELVRDTVEFFRKKVIEYSK